MTMTEQEMRAALELAATMDATETPSTPAMAEALAQLGELKSTAELMKSAAYHRWTVASDLDDDAEDGAKRAGVRAQAYDWLAESALRLVRSMSYGSDPQAGPRERASWARAVAYNRADLEGTRLKVAHIFGTAGLWGHDSACPAEAGEACTCGDDLRERVWLALLPRADDGDR